MSEDNIAYIDELIVWIFQSYTDAELKQKGPKLLSFLSDVKLQIKNPQSEQALAYFYKWISEIDRRRNVNFLNVFPELKPLYIKAKELAENSKIITDLDYLKL